MYVNSGYLRNSRVDFKDHTRPLVVGSCGTYRLSDQPAVLPSHRPRGRLDYQLLYVATGKTHFFFGGKEEIVPAGSVVLYCPIEEQKYIYYEGIVAKTVESLGLNPYYEPEVKGITSMTKLLGGKKKFDEILGDLVYKPSGKPVLVPESDKRKPMNTAQDDFKDN